MKTADLVGVFNCLLVVTGVFLQIRNVWRRKSQGQEPSERLHFSYIVGSWLAFLSMSFYGASLSPFNFYIVTSRFVATLSTLWLIWEVSAHNRDQARWRIARQSSMLITVVSALAMVMFLQHVVAAHTLLYGATILSVAWVAVGLLSQNIEAQRTGSMGALSPGLFVFNTTKDISNVLFGCVLGTLGDGGPLFIGGLILLALKIHTLILFRRYDYRNNN